MFFFFIKKVYKFILLKLFIMINKIKQFSQSITAKLLFITLVIAFVIWGIGDRLVFKPSNIVAKVGNTEITSNMLLHELNLLMQNENIKNKKIAIDLNLHQIALEKIISDILIEKHLNKLNLVVTETSIANEIKNMDIFNENNKFSRVKYEKFLLNNRINSQTFERRIKNYLEKKIIMDVVEINIPISKYYIKQIKDFHNNGLEIEYIELSKLVTNKKIDQNSIINFYEQNKSSFTTKELRNYDIILLKPSDLTTSDQVTNDFYKKIDLIEDDINKKINIKKILEKYDIKQMSNYETDNEGIDKKNKKINLEKALIDKIFTLNSNENKILEYEGNFYLISIKNIDPIKIKNLDENLKNEIHKTLLDKELINKIKEIKNEFNNKDYNFFEKIKKTYNLNSEKKVLKNRNDIFLNKTNNTQILFSNPLNKIYFYRTDEKDYLIINKEIRKNNEEIQKNYSLEAKKNLQNKFYSLYDFYLMELYNVKTYQKNINDLLKNI